MMQIVIDIPDRIHYGIEKGITVNGSEASQIVLDAVKNGTPLPKGHGRLIDANSIYQIVRPIEPSDAEWGMTAETAKRIIHDAFDSAPTIIEADKAESEDK